MIESIRVATGLTTGGAGSSTANATSAHAVVGKILAVILEYLGSPPAATTDVVVATAGVNQPAITLHTITNAATNNMFLVRHKVVDNAGANISYETTNAKDVYDSPVIADFVKVTVSQANDADEVVAVILYETGR